MKALHAITNFIGRIINLSGIFSGVLILLLSLFVCWGVIARFFLIEAHWVEPVTVYMFVASSFLATSYAMKNLEHIRVDILIQKLSLKARKILDTLLMIIALFFFSYVTWRSFAMFQNSYDRNTTDLSLLQIPLWIPQIFVVVGFIFLCLAIVRHIILTWIQDNYGIISEQEAGEI